MFLILMFQDMFVDMTKPHPVCLDDEEVTNGKPKTQQDTTLNLDNHGTFAATEASDGKPAIDSKPQIRIRNPPGGKSSIFF